MPQPDLATAWPVGGLVCPAPAHRTDGGRVLLGHGSGGKLSAALLREHFLPRFANPLLEPLGDGAVVSIGSAEIVISTDTFVVSPLEFPGGNIGSLAVHGTVNDVAMMGARPVYLTAGFVLEEGLELDRLDRIVASMAHAAADAGVTIVAGDTKVVERGKADGLFVNTTGVGIVRPGFRPAADRARPNDAVLVSGPVGRHGMAIMAAREGLEFHSAITSDSANLAPLVGALHDAVGDAVRVLRDPTRGGLASALNEIAQSSGVGIELVEGRVPIPADVKAACEILGLDPLYVANEGVLVAIVSPDKADEALAAARGSAVGRQAVIAGRVIRNHPGYVSMQTALGGRRIVDLLPGDQLPRIC